MTHDDAGLGEAGFDGTATRALALADDEARQLGHERVGTEHVLLGLLTNASSTSTTLSDVGVTLIAARSKVAEAVGEVSRSRHPPSGPLPRTARVTRALGRSARFAHARGSQLVTSDHVLMGVLDVEGIAGQVLRGLGVDVDALRAALDESVTIAPDDTGRSSRPDASPDQPTPSCSRCGAALEEVLAYRVVAARSVDGSTRDAPILFCGACGQAIGAAPA
jgi:ATP-dependent Clp protease ATP-binding subunit ClpC